MTADMMAVVQARPACCTLNEPDEIELLDLETFEAPRRMSDRDCLDHTGGEGRRQPQTELEMDDEQ